MRDPKRIDDLLELIGKIWRANPDLRLGQLIMNTRETSKRPGYTAVDSIVEMLTREDGVMFSKLLDMYCRTDGFVEKIPAAQPIRTRYFWEK